MTTLPDVACAVCDAPNAAFLLDSGAPVCGTCFMTLGAPGADTWATDPSRCDVEGCAEFGTERHRDGHRCPDHMERAP